jgi:hypothetical protein
LRPTTSRSTRGAWRRRDQVVRLARLWLLSSPPTWIYHSCSLVSLVLHTLPLHFRAFTLSRPIRCPHTHYPSPRLPLNDLTISASTHPPLSRNNTTTTHIQHALLFRHGAEHLRRRPGRRCPPPQPPRQLPRPPPGVSAPIRRLSNPHANLPTVRPSAALPSRTSTGTPSPTTSRTLTGPRSTTATLPALLLLPLPPRRRPRPPRPPRASPSPPSRPQRSRPLPRPSLRSLLPHPRPPRRLPSRPSLSAATLAT